MHQRGFTLVEISIVILIIGLLSAGILVGRDLIEAALVRAQIAQLEQFSTAVNTFRLKYGGYPGDLTADKASAFGMSPRIGSSRHGDGNELLQSCVSANRSTYNFGCETALFWNDLSFAQLIGQNFSLDVDDYGGTSGITVPQGQQQKYFPNAKIGDSNYIAVYSDDKRGESPIITVDCPSAFCFAIDAIKATTVFGQFDVRQGALSARQAYSIDQKMDDGVPLRGRVQSSSIATGVGYLSLIGGVDGPGEKCFSDNAALGVIDYASANAASLTYRLSGPDIDAPACSLSVTYK